MQEWKVVIEYKGEIREVLVKAPYYSDAYVLVEEQYKGCAVKNITKVPSESE